MENKDNGIIQEDTTMSIGFRRWLLAVYAHTGAHVVAAPMAHYLAMHGSRFRYSHNNMYFPVNGIENFIHGVQTIMRYKSDGKKRVPFHRCMNYIYRPDQLGYMCTYEFFSQVITTPIKKGKSALKTADTGDMTYTQEHPFHTSMECDYYDSPVIPYFPWNFLPSTIGFKTSLHSSIRNEEDEDYRQKEEYCKRFLLLFLPFRKKEDLVENGSYTRRMQTALSSKEIDKAMVQVAENIQRIHNSLNSAMVENILHATTVLEEDDGTNTEQNQENDEETEQLILLLGTALASTTKEILQEEATELYPQEPKRLEFRNIDKIGQILPAFLEESGSYIISEGNNTAPSKQRFCTNISTLNKLVIEAFLTKKDIVLLQSNSTGNNLSNLPLCEKWNIEANGTWESIIGWSKVNGLDEDQQTAFEILAATFVLSFHEDKVMDETEHSKLKEQHKSLCCLARRGTDDTTYLRLFVTGPAGAGKCK